jgi:uncharacterized integral membrane protein
MSILKWAFFLLILMAAISFAIQNDQLVSLKYYFGWESLPLPLYLWAFLSFFIGLILSGLMTSLSKISLLSQIRQQKKALGELEKKRDAMKSDPSRLRG